MLTKNKFITISLTNFSFSFDINYYFNPMYEFLCFLCIYIAIMYMYTKTNNKIKLFLTNFIF